MFHPILDFAMVQQAGRLAAAAAGGPRRAVAGRQAVKAGRNAPGKPLCGSFCTQPPDIAGGMNPRC